MKHLKLKLLAIIVACSATMLLNVNVRAAKVARTPRVVTNSRRIIKNRFNKRIRITAHRARGKKRIKVAHHVHIYRHRGRSSKRGRRPQTRFNERVVNQKKSAVNHFNKKIRYVYNSRPSNFTSSGNYGDSDYGRKGFPISGQTNNGRLTFNRLTFIPKHLGRNQFYSPQGLAVIGHYAYIITNATNSYESDHSDLDKSGSDNGASVTSPYKLGANQIFRIDLNRHIKDYNNLKAARRDVKVGPVFYGGHGQGFAYNPRQKELWLLDNKQGQVNKTAVSLINLRSLLPQLRINFHFGDTTIGDDLTFTQKGQAMNVTEAGNDSFAKAGSIKIFQGSVTPRNINMKLIEQALSWAPSSVIQGLTYNGRNNRLYILGDDSITSIPVNRLGRLRKNDVWHTSINSTRELEGLAFDGQGNSYLLVNRSPEILSAKYNKHLHF